MASGRERRLAYEGAVRALRQDAEALLAGGADEPEVARTLVQRRNAIKRSFRDSDPPEIVQLMEARNLAKYGDPLGPDAEWLFAKYGSWRLVIEAACRPANLRDL